MKILIFVCLLSMNIFSSAQQSFKKQLTNYEYDSRNPKIFSTYNSINDQVVVFESHKDSAVNIALMKYEYHNDSFYTPLSITSNLSMNINASCGFNGFKRIIIWQTNRNGNWDIEGSVGQGSSWSPPFSILSSNENEIEPNFGVMHPHAYGDNFAFTFRRGNSIFLYSNFNGYVTIEEMFSGSDSIVFSQPTSEIYSLPGYYNYFGNVVAVMQENGKLPKIVFTKRYLVDSLWSEMKTVFDSGYCHSPRFFNRFSFESIINGKNSVYFLSHPDSFGHNYKARCLQSDSLVQTYAYSELNLIIPGKILWSQYNPRTYRMIKNELTYLYITYGMHAWPYDTLKYTLVPTKIRNSSSIVAPMGDVRKYTIWEDSSDGRINLFGAIRSDLFTSVEDKYSAINFVLYQNYPNPFNSTTRIKYSVLSNENVSLKIYDILGREVATLVNEVKPPGEYEVQFTTDDPSFDGRLTSSVYFYQLRAGDFVETKKMIYLK